MPSTLIQHATIINEGKRFLASVLISDGKIARILPEPETCNADEIIDASGLYLLPGVIDDHVHFREPGLTHKADIFSESRAAAAGGVTSYFDMPNTKPLTTTIEALDAKFGIAAQKSLVNYSFFFGATNSNASMLSSLKNRKDIPGIKLFMGSSTGNMLVDQKDALIQVFQNTPKDMVIMAHCEDTQAINKNAERLKKLFGDDPEVIHHPEIRDVEACYKSTSLAIQMAKETGARLHVAHLTTAKELDLFQAVPYHKGKKITAEACIAHLYFTDEDYKELGTRIKCNPSVKTSKDRDALRQGLIDGRIDVIGTDHAPHLLSEKQGGCLKAASGMPMVQFSLVAMLELTLKGVLTLEQTVNLMCHRPAELFSIHNRGYIREGYQADLVLVNPSKEWTVKNSDILSKCGWSPMEGQTFHHQIEYTFCNGNKIYQKGTVIDSTVGLPLEFR